MLPTPTDDLNNGALIVAAAVVVWIIAMLGLGIWGLVGWGMGWLS